MPIEQLQLWISHYGYAAIVGLLMFGIVGLPIPDETLLTLVGYLIFRGVLLPVPAWCSALGGTICGITLSYGIGRLGGKRLLHRYGHRLHLAPNRIERVHRWFHRLGKWALVFGYFVPGVRHLIAIVAGSSDVGYRHFAQYAYFGATVWSAVFLAAGFVLGQEWARFPGIAHTVALIATAVLLLGALLFALLRRSRPGRSQTRRTA